MADRGNGSAKETGYGSMYRWWQLKRREFLQLSSVASAGIVLGTPALGEDSTQNKPADPPPRPATNIDEIKLIPRTKTSLPGPFPGRVVAVFDERVVAGRECGRRRRRSGQCRDGRRATRGCRGRGGHVRARSA